MRNIASLLAFAVWVAAVPSIAGTSPSPYWKNSIVFPDDPFTHQTSGLPQWIKFTILTADPTTVYFQDSVTYEFHYDFAVNELAPFEGFTPNEFDAVTLHATGQQAILGAVLFPPASWLPEFAIQLVRLDPYTPAEVIALFNLVRSSIAADPGVRDFYFPTYEQLPTALEHEALLSAHGVTVGSVDRWLAGNTCYSFGWALGRLKHVPPGEIESAFVSGLLEPGDVLLTDAVPSSLPPVAGIVSLAPATPNSHVVILADTFDVPFVHLALPEDIARAEALAGRLVVLRSDDTSQGCRAHLIDAEELDQATIDEILLFKQLPPLNLVPIATLGAYSANTAGLHPADIRFFGGKAANYGFIRRSIPASSPVAGALSFDLWSEFLGQPVAGGGTLLQWIATTIGAQSWPPTDMGALATALADVRERIEDDTFFTPTLQAAVFQMLQSPQYGFDSMSNIRFRSSTNVEDSDQFTGAGLYDSFSGCLADDLDANGSGPSLCDPTEAKERGVFRAIRKVFASFYNLNAYLERLRHGVQESQVGMAMLVHHSFPDEFELANGVATFERGNGITRLFRFVSQAGAVSVTNPEPGALPEIVEGYTSGPFSSFTLVAESNLVQLGATVLEYTEEYQELASLMQAVATAYEQETGLAQYVLEFEYKKVAPGGAALPGGGLELDQVRRLPQTDDTPSITPFLINEPAELCVFQGEYANVFANHRLNSRWSVSTVNTWLDSASFEQSLLGETTIHYAESCIALEQSGVPASWPEATHSYADGATTDTWRLDFLQNPRDWTLTMENLPTLVSPADSPIVVLEDFGCLPLRVDYDTPVPSVELGQPTMTTTDEVLLCPCPEPRPDDIPRQRQASEHGTTVDVSFYWPTPPTGIVAGYTAPLSRFERTTITGLTTLPLVLESERSQTYRPEHHNFSENFIFEPVLEPALTAQQRAELERTGVRVLHVLVSFGESSVTPYEETAWGSVCLDCLGDDADGDGACVLAPTFDCDDADSSIWETPGEVRDLRFTSLDTLGWSAPESPGATNLTYDVLRSATAHDFLGTSASCIATNAAGPSAVDDADPSAGVVIHYLVRARNGCAEGLGSLGAGSDGAERQGLDCPSESGATHRSRGIGKGGVAIKREPSREGADQH